MRARAWPAAVGLVLWLAAALVAPDPVAGRGVGQGADSVVVHAGPGLERVAAALARDSAVLAPMPGIGPPLAVLPASPTLWVVRDLGDVPGAPGVEPDWVAGLALPDRHILAVRAAGAGAGRLGSLRSTTRHELAHLALHAVTGGRAPRWLQEGYAQLAASDWDWGQAWRLRVAILRQGTDALSDLDASLRGGEDRARLAYLLSYTAVHRLVEMGGPGALRALFDRLRAGDSMDAALRSVYGVTEAQFIRRWEAGVRDRYGWLFLLSRASLFWIAIAVLLLLVGWRRRRYDRQRMERLRRQEAASEARERWAGDEGQGPGPQADPEARPPADSDPGPRPGPGPGAR
jgi:hypothetical protein